MDSILAHFKKSDPVLFAAIKNTSWFEPSQERDPFSSLCRIIIGQQLSTKAAHSIYQRFADLFPRQRPRPTLVLDLPEPTLKAAGLSSAKCRAIRNLAEQVQDKTLPLPRLPSMSDEAVTDALVKITGIGPWSAEMFLIFHLGRTDVFSPGDQGLKTAIKRLYGLPELPNAAEASAFAQCWSPYRSYACQILWASLDNEPN